MTRRLFKLAGEPVPSLNVLRAALGSAGVQTLNRVATLILGIVLARTMGAADYGVYSFAFAIMVLLALLAEAGIPMLVMREVAASRADERWGRLRGALVHSGQFVLLTSLSVSVMGLVILAFFAGHLHPDEVHTLQLMFLVLPLAALVRTMGYIMRGLNRVVIGQIIELLLRPLFALSIVAVVFGLAPALRGPHFAMAAQVAASALAVVAGCCVMLRYWPAEVRATPIEFKRRDWLKGMVPFTLIGGAAVINNQTDIVMLGWLRSADEVGIYRAASQGATLVAFGLQAVNAVIAPRFASLYAKADMVTLQRVATAAARATTLLALPFAAIFVVFGRELLVWIVGPDFATGSIPLAILSIGQLTSAVMGSVGYLLNMTGNEGDTAKTLWMTAVANIVLNACLIPLYGTVGAAIASLLSLMAWNVLLFRIARRRLGINSTALG